MKPKYNIGDTIFFIDGRGIREDKVTGVKIRQNFIYEPYFTYEFSTSYQEIAIPQSITKYDYHDIEEQYIFPTKEELLASL